MSQFDDAEDVTPTPASRDLPRASALIAAELHKYAGGSTADEARRCGHADADTAYNDAQEDQEEDEDFDDFIEDENWFDGHEGGGGNFTKNYKATVAGNRPNSATTQHA
eukprot:CAMPEP_0180221602 /NCGR_PEP_ID=MMETSP0987-20121128/20014_1 /TAXON_ID=697907 /ORGANISM="non described non described, Strain CCMP2293" /LENGTH=108 /DNA_ID=CAMNT_0022183133 /DNA_START=9 /DNA_END=331 /DNA_ORIENTATION=+